MATLREIFEKDAMQSERIHTIHKFTNKISREVTEVTASVVFDFEAGAKYALLYIPESDKTSAIINHYINDINEILKVADAVEIAAGFHDTDEYMASKDLRFSGRLAVYAATTLASEEKLALCGHAANRGLNLLVRDGAYLRGRVAAEVPQAFICHDTRDKEPFVRELAVKLEVMFFSVWYDEYSLKAGDSLRASIEKGLKECKKCVLVLSPNFVSNEGWTKAEFDSIFTREILQMKQIMIPVWHGVSKEDVFNYSPRLLDKVGIPSTLGVEEVARRIIHAMPR